MIHGLLIAIVAIVLARDALPGLPLWPSLQPWLRVALTLGPMILVAAIAHIAIARCGAQLDRTGQWRSVRRAERVLGASRAITLIVHTVAIVGLGWLDLVRVWLGGNLVLVDEAVASTPAILVIIAGWWSFASIDQRLHQAALVRALDSGGALPSLVSRSQYVLEQIRHHLLLILIPIGAIVAWNESVDWATRRWTEEPTTLEEAGITALQFAGVFGVVALMPLVVRTLWRTVPMAPGPMRTRLTTLCRAQGVRCRNLLVWRTHSDLLNGALIGVLPHLRYILLTQTLLERLREVETEAVMAHEVAHARRHHLPWLMVGLIASMGVTWMVGLLALELAPQASWLGDMHSDESQLMVIGLLFAVSLGVGLLVFSYISRRFEQQADAFAAQHLSGLCRANQRDRQLVIEPHAVAAMASALGMVAAVNGISPQRFSWRHGSIRSRQQRLAALVGVPAWRLPIDRVVTGIKVASLIGLVVIGILGMWRPELLPV